MEIIRATPAMAARLTELAFAAKRSWGYPARWITLWNDLLTITPEIIQTNEVYAAVLADAAIAGFYALLPDRPMPRLEHLWVLPALMGRGIGRALFAHALERASALGATQIQIESDPQAEGFYLRMGARRLGETVTDLDGQRRILPILVADVTSLA
jgi:GNAT superfamily N-acetyltransferase